MDILKGTTSTFAAWCRGVPEAVAVDDADSEDELLAAGVDAAESLVRPPDRADVSAFLRGADVARREDLGPLVEASRRNN